MTCLIAPFDTKNNDGTRGQYHLHPTSGITQMPLAGYRQSHLIYDLECRTKDLSTRVSTGTILKKEAVKELKDIDKTKELAIRGFIHLAKESDNSNIAQASKLAETIVDKKLKEKASNNLIALASLPIKEYRAHLTKIANATKPRFSLLAWFSNLFSKPTLSKKTPFDFKTFFQLIKF